MKYLLTFEKLGVNKDVEKLADLLEPILNENRPILQTSKKVDLNDLFFDFILPENFLKHKYTFVAYVNRVNINRMNLIWEDNTMHIILHICLEEHNKISRKSLEHELLHLYQFSRTFDFEKEFFHDEVGDKIFNIKQFYSNNQKTFSNDNEISAFNWLFYISFNAEIFARVQETLEELKELNTTKENFNENIKKTHTYEYCEQLLNCDKFFDNIEDPIKFYERMKYLYKNGDFLSNIDARISNLFIKRPKLNKFIINTFLPKMDNVSEKEAKEFINKFRKIFKKKGKIFLNKLSKLYGHF